MTRIWTGTASVVSGYTTVELSGDPLSDATCPADATIVLGGETYFVSELVDTTTVDLTRIYEGVDNPSISAEIDPMTPAALSVVNATLLATRVQAQLNILDKNSQGLFFTRLGVTGDADPLPGHIAFNNADPTAITEIYADNVDGNDRSVTGLLGQWSAGTVLVVRSLTTTAYVSLRMSSNNSALSGYFKGIVTHVDHDGVIADGEDISIGWFRVGEGLAFDASGSLAGRDAYDGQDTGFAYLSDEGLLYVKQSADASPADWGVGIPLQGPAGFMGWSPTFALANDSARRVLQLTGYVGGQGSAPTTDVGKYVSASGYTSTIASAMDIRGAAGVSPTVAVGTVTPLASGATPTVVNGGTSSAAVFNFGLPVPDDGEDGADGTDGTDPGALLVWSTATAGTDQGAGKIWADNTLDLATKVYVSKTGRNGEDLSASLPDMVTSTNPTRKSNFVLSRSGGNAFTRIGIAGIVDHTGFVEFTVDSGGNPATDVGFATNDLISLQDYAVSDRGASGAGTGDVNGPGAAVAHRIATYADTSGSLLEDGGKLLADLVLAANNGSDFASKQATFDTLSLDGADIASATTLNLETATGSFVAITGTTATTAITLSDGHRRRVLAAAAWPITVGASLVLNNGGSSYTCAAGDIIDFVADGTVIRGTINRIGGAIGKADLDTDGTLAANSDTKVASQKATKTYVDGQIATAAAGVAQRGTVRVATTANITIATALNNGDSLDGVTLVTGDLVLVKDQSAPETNGVYVVGASPARDAQFDTYNEHPGALIIVEEGTANADSFWYCTSNKGGTLNTTSITFAALTFSVADDSITNAKLANVATATIKGRASGSTGDPEDLTPAQVAALMSMMLPANLGLAASVSSNALTISIKGADGNDPSATNPVFIPYRNVTPGTGTPTSLTLTAAASIVVSSGSTLGTASGIAARLWVVSFNDGGTQRLGVINCRSGTDAAGYTIYPLQDFGIASSAAEGGAGAADSALVFYTDTAVTSKAYTVLGYIEITEATAGTWATAHTLAQMHGHGKLPGEVVQTIPVQDSTVASGTTVMPIDNTIPQNNEGIQFMTGTIAPTSGANVLQVDHVAVYSNSAGGAFGVALFRDSGAGAIGAVNSSIYAANQSINMALSRQILAGATTSTDLKIRAGGISAGTTRFNGFNGAQVFGGVAASSLILQEIMS